jgi:hypothetical protein
MSELGSVDGVNDIDLGDISDAELNAILESGDAAAIESLMRGEKPEPKLVPEDSKLGEEHSAASSAESEGDTSQKVVVDEAKAPIQSKDGKRTIPYEVLESARERAKELASETVSLREKLAEYEGKNQKVNKFLAAKGFDPESITSEQAESLSADDIKQLEEIDPLFGKAVRVMSEQIARSNAQPAPAQTTGSPVLDAIAANADLSAWRESDPDRWDFAKVVDDKLKADPKFSSLPLAERFEEAARRTRIAFGDEANTEPSTAATAAKKVAEAAAAAVPRSLSNIGVTPSSEKSLIEQLAELPPHLVEARMAKMTPAQIQEVLGGIQ